MSKRPEHHVVPASDGGWDVIEGGSHDLLAHFAGKKDAVDYARDVSRSQGTELVIHNRDGRISAADSHGNDPASTPG